MPGYGGCESLMSRQQAFMVTRIKSRTDFYVPDSASLGLWTKDSIRWETLGIQPCSLDAIVGGLHLRAYSISRDTQKDTFHYGGGEATAHTLSLLLAQNETRRWHCHAFLISSWSSFSSLFESHYEDNSPSRGVHVGFRPICKIPSASWQMLVSVSCLT